MKTIPFILVRFDQDYFPLLVPDLPDISPNNLFQGIEDVSVLDQIEEDEIARPIARKILRDRQITLSRPLRSGVGLPKLSDFGEARICRTKQRGDIMPGIYRAPEVIIGIEWDNKVDVWSIGVMVSQDFRLALGQNQS